MHSQKGCAIIYKLPKNGGLAQLVRASASHAEGRRFESAALHQQKSVFCQRTKGAFLHDVFRWAERDVHCVRDVSRRRDVRSAREKEHITATGGTASLCRRHNITCPQGQTSPKTRSATGHQQKASFVNRRKALFCIMCSAGAEGFAGQTLSLAPAAQTQRQQHSGLRQRVNAHHSACPFSQGQAMKRISHFLPKYPGECCQRV